MIDDTKTGERIVELLTKGGIRPDRSSYAALLALGIHGAAHIKDLNLMLQAKALLTELLSRVNDGVILETVNKTKMEEEVDLTCPICQEPMEDGMGVIHKIKNSTPFVENLPPINDGDLVVCLKCKGILVVEGKHMREMDLASIEDEEVLGAIQKIIETHAKVVKSGALS